ncbi:box C/D snoRNA protein 1 isoform X2 [Melanotaenia boesemani]|uniref:box C/D snoRNA protein 1 isoform X2 n=1 Tax=Melanotaenia boesemani TaxID=1250792 RepID=UPI001C040597|nr:box C/D snoRNA protein 1 isoform X2 [Melanotaenia boesemani]
MSSMESQVDSFCEEEEQKSTKRKISLSSCGVCRSDEAKYRCPSCHKHSCSLLCVKKHKDDSGCSGVRNKTAFVTLSHFDEMTLLSDYRFLEDTGRFADGATRDNLIRVPRSTFKAKRMAVHARKMNITLRFLPVTFTKSKENSTFFLPKVADTQTLMQILSPYIHPTDSDPVIRQKLKMYVNSPFDHVKVFIKAEGRKANSVRYHELDIEKSLRDNLSYKTLIEYPVLHVVLRDHWKEYPLKGPAEPVLACLSSATKNAGTVQDREAVAWVSPSVQESCTPVATNIQRRPQESTPETESPLEKRPKRRVQMEEQEEGEIMDTSDEEEGTNENTLCDESQNISRSAANDMENVDYAASDVKYSSNEQCAIKDITAPTDHTLAFREHAEVTITKEDMVKEPEVVHTHHTQDRNEPAGAVDSWQME